MGVSAEIDVMRRTWNLTALKSNRNFKGKIFMWGSLVQCALKDYIAPRKVGLDIILANPVRAGTQQP